MTGVVFDNDLLRRIIARRKRTGADRWDEVWDGVYMIMPLPNDEHQGIVSGLIFVLETVIGRVDLGKVRPGVNISDRNHDWKRNYRGPDVVVFLSGTTAVNHDSFWLGGPDFAVEILSKGDRARKKLDFYASVNVRELLIVDRYPWSLDLYRLRDGVYELVGRSTIVGQVELASEVLPLGFRLMPGTERPVIEVRERGGERRWSV